MGVLELVYVFLHLLVTYLHYFHVAFSELIDRLRPVFGWKRPATTTFVQLGANNNEENLLLKYAGSELKQLKKLPSHVACLFAERDLNVDRVVSVISWCSAAGISCISLFDHEGILVSNKDVIQAELNRISSSIHPTSGLKQRTFTVNQGFIQKEDFYQQPSSTDVFLLSRADGRPLLAQIAKEVASRHDYLKINQSLLETSIGMLYPGEPELMLQFGTLLSNATFGYPPWHLRLTQMMRVPGHARVQADHIASAMLVYGCCQQRYGK